jgi:MFS family permease|uniref:MFS transporter n=1 Tax=candidate division WOR-3 bacterium TaxID=2052148 RepID=A0A7V5Y0M1_UNCW3
MALEKEREESLRYSLWDGIFASITAGFSQNYLTPFALFLKASNFAIGLLNSLPQFISAFFYIPVADIVEKFKSRKKVIAQAVYLQALTFILIAFLSFLVNYKIQPFTIFLILLILNNIFNAFATPIWQSLMSDTVEKERYGRYFAYRGRVLGFVTLIANFLCGFLLYLLSKNKILGFFLIFIIAGLSRFLSGYFISLMHDFPIKIVPEKRFSYYSFIKRLPESNFVKFTLYVALMNFATYIAAPFFAVYMLKDLKFSYATYTLITTASTLASLLSLPLWGNLADRYGNARILKISGLLIPLIPLLWLFSKNPIYLILINAYAGYSWAGFNLCALNFIFDATSPEVRTRCLGYFNFTNSFTLFIGGIIGGYLANRLPIIFPHSRLLTLIFLSGILRILVNIILANKFQEVRKTEKIEEKELLAIVLGIRPLINLSEDLFFFFKKKNN